ncbi:N-6 adenine-specific DNA methylase [Acetobacter orleanensis NRIC 0473]|uniref:DNA methyltransferase n=1 Tax=Acetobacter orleanensis TaxID=104099 RepID=A0A4Y3TLQ9_9PROT|nr:methyltransferase [Acetobacter orleanensis]PCD79498.1 16S rRNA (guanine(966)-N(2))-methyltransferase RsmD [Acetobacter orleanensis]GAN69477.1 N6-adenine-specific methylase [Acetobacter orleanensis JCM 7639]GBR25904.1 N-6 adenine-specific DNA methylase [Acetobacter orleanensis NRIC 0473]GEB83931.1 DNA methyltransferase [Acetobacter orleanensis]
MRIIAGDRKGRVLAAPTGTTTRPTADRVRQAIFDILLHAPWGGPDLFNSARVLDAFAGTGALGLEALSRGADYATFFEKDRAALVALRSNIAGCRWEDRSKVIPRDVTKPTHAPAPCSLLFLDPPYRQDLPARTLAALHAQGWIAPNALAVIETAAQEPLPLRLNNAEEVDIPPEILIVAEGEDAPPPPVYAGTLLAERRHGAARLSIWRL